MNAISVSAAVMIVMSLAMFGVVQVQTQPSTTTVPDKGEWKIVLPVSGKCYELIAASPQNGSVTVHVMATNVGRDGAFLRSFPAGDVSFFPEDSFGARIEKGDGGWTVFCPKGTFSW